MFYEKEATYVEKNGVGVTYINILINFFGQLTYTVCRVSLISHIRSDVKGKLFVSIKKLCEDNLFCDLLCLVVLEKIK